MTETPTPPPELPVRIDPAHWIGTLDGIASDETLRRWCRQPRFQHRLAERLQRRHDLPAQAELPPRDPIDQALCLLDEDALTACTRAAGIIFHAGALVREIRAPRVAAVKQRFGTDLYALALAKREHGQTGDSDLGDLDAFEAEVEQDGRRCLLAWADAQPATLRAWLRLGWFGRLERDAGAEANAGAVEIARLAAADRLASGTEDAAQDQPDEPAAPSRGSEQP
ncbi:hypothetical protein F0A16_11195 [Salinicola corii]|uniref:Type III secretion protein n=1 Tax=Salinicola corii TaxID=2606937 RepID=A0A640WE79_9GAMM|nr:hypothetical protein [Salinicola corii]KAA0018273.1 hypothetical protein F0A16_11195 [Salinicola corii]